RERDTTIYQPYVAERRNCRGGGTMVSDGVYLHGHIDFHVFLRGTLTAEMYRDDILVLYARPYGGAIANDFILNSFNTCPHRFRLIDRS
ncbi:hypothetical protein AVEN_208475-1, partial [Araneus ventricosus]